jgi:hypothetical protein
MDPVGLARIAIAGAVAGTFFATDLPARAAEPSSPVRVELWADRDDDDADGHPDGEQTMLATPARVDLVAIDRRLVGAAMEVVSGAEHARLVSTLGKPMAWDRAFPGSGWFQGLSPGRVELAAQIGDARARTVMRVVIDVRGIEMRDGEGRLVDMARSHASLERSPPSRIEGAALAPYDDVDALRVLVSNPDDGSGPTSEQEISVESLNASGMRLDTIPNLPLLPAPCAAPSDGLRCSASAPLRFVIDDVDRNHPLVAERSIKASLGGAIVFRHAGRKAQMIRLLGPRSSPAGPIARLRATIRPLVVRVTQGGAPSVGGNDAGAIEALRSELAAASAVWGQCGITFGDPRSFEVKLVDPPPSHLVSFGDDLGIPASGGRIRLRADGKSIVVTTAYGEMTDRVAADVARAAERVGLVAIVSPNARIGPGLGPSVDVSLRRKDGTLVSVDSERGQPLSTDPTLSVRIGSVDLSDGLEHFTDLDAMAGTLEERTLVKALDDGDPATIEVIVVPLFAGGGRIGESFIASDVSSVRNVVLLDRAGIRARKSSLTLAHELGHVLMDMPGHPDDYGVDTPTLLMDSDAADASPFGPRRISLEECARVVRQAGPRARLPMLVEWPIGPVPDHARAP